MAPSPGSKALSENNLPDQPMSQLVSGQRPYTRHISLSLQLLSMQNIVNRAMPSESSLLVNATRFHKLLFKYLEKSTLKSNYTLYKEIHSDEA